MLSPDQIESAGDAVAAIYSDMEAQMLDHLVDVLLDVDRLDQRSLTELNLLAQSITADLTRIVEDNKAYIADEVYETCEKFLKASDKDDIKRLGEGSFIFPQQLSATVTGMQLVLDRQNIKMVEGAKTAFLNASIEAVTKVNSGLYTTEKALHAAVRKLEGDGIPIEYVTYQNPKTGKTTITNHVDVAVRRHIRTQIAQDGARMTLDRLNALDVALVEVSSHEGARPTHQAWEGRCYSLKGDIVIENTRYPDFYSATGYGQVDGLLGANCRHSFGPYRHGAPRAYEPNPESETGLSNDEIYQLTQKQRQLERKIRDDKRQLRGAQQEYEKNPDKIENKTNLIKAKDTLAKRQKQMRDFIDDSNAKCKKGTTVLHRNPRREWAGDMPKGVKVNASHRNLDDFLTSRSSQLKNAGISKTRMKAAISGEMAKRGGKASDFSSLTGAEQDSLFKKLKSSIDAKLPSTKKANAGKHVKKPTTIDRSASIYSKLESKHINKIAEIVEKANNAVSHTYTTYEKRLTLIDGRSPDYYFSRKHVGVFLDVESIYQGKKFPSMNSWFHEFGHHIDYIATGDGNWQTKFNAGMRIKDVAASTVYKNGLFDKTIQKEVDALIDAKRLELMVPYKKALRNFDIDTLYKSGYIPERKHYTQLKDMVSHFGNQKWYEKNGYTRHDVSTLEGQQTEVSRLLGVYAESPTRDHACKAIENEIKTLSDAKQGDISDIFEGATRGGINGKFGHMTKNDPYWDADNLALSREAFAEMFSAYTSNPESLAILKHYLPESVDVFDEIIEAIKGGSLNA